MLRTYAMSVIGVDRANLVALKIIKSSQWFEFTPLPDDEYEFKVKEENGGMLQQYVTAAYDIYPLERN